MYPKVRRSAPCFQNPRAATAHLHPESLRKVLRTHQNQFLLMTGHITDRETKSLESDPIASEAPALRKAHQPRPPEMSKSDEARDAGLARQVAAPRANPQLERLRRRVMAFRFREVMSHQWSIADPSTAGDSTHSRVPAAEV